MKKIILLATSFIMTLPLLADNNNIIYATIPTNFKLKDKVFICNYSPYTILQSVVAINSKPMKKIGECQFVGPNASVQLVDYDHNELKQLIGQEIAIKIKGTTQMLTRIREVNKGNGVIGNIISDVFGKALNTTEIDPELVNNMDSTKITYDFRVTLSEDNHDLYINVYKNSNQDDIMGF